MILLAVHMFYRKGKFTNFTKEVLCPPQSCYIQQIKCLKRAFDKITSNLFSVAVIRTISKSAGNILLQCREIITVIL